MQIVVFQKSHGNRSNEDKEFDYSNNEAWYIYREDYMLMLLAVAGIYIWLLKWDLSALYPVIWSGQGSVPDITLPESQTDCLCDKQ